ncbi:hypothetical protein [Planctomicrobium piriforme]|uniref:Uncharacterized protein n=1 Tax=Planctomicrobium piriforme TaxID=1576369 RepID=A0A1I3L7D4_9PLAN|nr:hypothetical protein [Planctomicrobium piriforme]SFI80673.1 hypothetical protein SAMN05421753_112165 [Planctomicrobium piriforme]
MSEVVSLHCPKCGRKLKIKDRALFGQKVKCPECKKSFILNDPDAPASPEPAVPQAATPPAAETPHLPGHPPLPVFGEPAARSAPSNPFDFTSPPPQTDLPFGFPPTPASPPPASANPFFVPPPGPAPAQTELPFAPPAAGVPAPSIAQMIDSEEDTITRLKQNRRRRNRVSVPLGIGLFVIAAGVAGYLLTQQKPSVPVVARQPVAAAPTPEEPVPSQHVYSRAALENDPALVGEFTPTKGEPIQLYMLPSGVNLVIHLRPALLWSDDYGYRVLRASLTDDVTNWLASQIKTICHRDPAQIEEALFGIVLGARGTPPQVCCVVRLKDPAKLSSLIEEFPGKYRYDVTEKPDVRLKVDDKFGYLIHDDRTFAICPVELADELENWIKTPNYEVTEGIAEQLKKTDRQRLFTVIGTVSDVQIHLKSLIPKPAQPLVESIVEWLGGNVDTAGWSVHPQPYLHSQVWLRPVSTKDAITLQAEMQDQLEKLPEQVWKDLCAKMSPGEVRFRKLIGRLPAMLEAFRESTISQPSGRNLQLTTVLPAKAAPNLALATLFTVNEAARTNFLTKPAVAADSKPKLPETAKERLELPVEAEFNRMPLEQALQFLCDEVQVKLVVEGDALKDAGYTKNMPQTFNLGKVPMKQALAQIINNYQEKGKEMVACLDEPSKTITVTTRKFALLHGQSIILP